MGDDALPLAKGGAGRLQDHRDHPDQQWKMFCDRGAAGRQRLRLEYRRHRAGRREARDGAVRGVWQELCGPFLVLRYRHHHHDLFRFAAADRSASAQARGRAQACGHTGAGAERCAIGEYGRRIAGLPEISRPLLAA